MKHQILFTLSLFFIAMSPAMAEVVVASGGRVKLDSVGAFDQACHSLGPMTANILQQPRGGTVSIERVLDYPNFSALNTRSRCNTSKLPETRLFYQSSPDYTGDDTVTIEWIGPGGGARHSLYRISVRPGVIAVPEQNETPHHTRRHSRHTQADVTKTDRPHRSQKTSLPHHPKAVPQHDQQITT